MEQHRANPNCASCHARMDPLGFAFENFDAIGAWRDKDGTFPIDASGTLPAGESFQGSEELKAILKTREKDFARCLAEKMLTYALGRGLEDPDKCAVDRIVDTMSSDQSKFSSLVLEIVKSDPFQRRKNRGSRTMRTARQISRRTVLRGLGTAIALPWLEAMAPPRRWPLRRVPPARRPPCGWPSSTSPTASTCPTGPRRRSAPTSRSPTSSSRSPPFKDDLLVLTGLAQENGPRQGDGPGDHARALSTFLTGCHPLKTDGANIRVGVSVDQVAAPAGRRAHPLPLAGAGHRPRRAVGQLRLRL